MGKRGWLNLVLLLVVVLLVALIYLEPGKQPQQLVLLTSLNPSSVQQIRIERPEEETVVLQRQGEQWGLIEPVEVSANQFAIQLILEVLSEESLQRYPAEGLNLQKYGLQQPRARLAIDDVELAFGRMNPLNSRLYIMVDNVMHMVAQSHISFLTQAWYRYVSPGLLDAGSELQMLSIPGLGRLERAADGWQFDGAVVPDSNAQMQSLVDAWRNARAMQVRPVGEVVAKEKIVVGLVSGAEISFGVLDTEEGLLLQRPELGLEYVFDNSQSQRLLQWLPLHDKAEEVQEPDFSADGV